MSFVLLVLLIMTGAAAQAPEGHGQHHPAAATVETPAAVTPPPPSPASPPAAPGAPQGMDMPAMMREMGRMMGGVPKKPLVARLLDAERMTEVERNALRGDAERRIQEGLALLERGTRQLADARRTGDDAALARAVQRLEEGAAHWETGRAVLQALSSPAPRGAGVRWFKSQMNLELPSTPLTIGGLSWRHATVMASLAFIVVAGAALYGYKVRRSLALLARLTRVDPGS